MPNKRSAEKALRQTAKRTLANQQVKDAYKKAIKDVRKTLAKGETASAEQLRLAQKKLDKAAKKGVIKATTAARKLSRLAKQVSAK